jgi:hypothetical protein
MISMMRIVTRRKIFRREIRAIPVYTINPKSFGSGDDKKSDKLRPKLNQEMKLMAKLIIKNLVNYETNSYLSHLSQLSYFSYS